MKNLFLTLLLASTLTSPGLAADGNEGGGGGDAINNSGGGRSLLDLVESNSVNYFEMDARKFDSEFGQAISDLAFSKFVSGVGSVGVGFRNFNVVLDRQLRIAGDMLNPALRWAWVDHPLEELNDEGQIAVQSTVTKKQLAVQKNGIVFVNRYEFNQLDNRSKAALKLHEELIFSLLTLNPSLINKVGTAPIRAVVRSFEGVFSGKMPIHTLKDSVRSLNIPDSETVAIDTFKWTNHEGNSFESVVSLPVYTESSEVIIDQTIFHLDTMKHISGFTFEDFEKAVKAYIQKKHKWLKSQARYYSKISINEMQMKGQAVPSTVNQ